MQFEYLFRSRRDGPPVPVSVRVEGRDLPVEFVRNPKARRYILRLRGGTVARVTVPRGGSLSEARAFVERQVAWLAQQLRKPRTTANPVDWTAGTEVFFRGERHPLQAALDGRGVQFADQQVRLDPASRWRRSIERHLHRLAAVELPARVHELATQQGIRVLRVSVRNQRTRWGSCSARGTVSINWRLIQMPPSVCDYIILHELMHTREMNHSARFWRQVELVCPAFREAEKWIRQNAPQLRA